MKCYRWPGRSLSRDITILAGYVVINGLLDTEEVDIVRAAMEQDDALDTHEMLVDSGADGAAAPARQTLWTEPGTGTLGALTRSERVCGAATQLLEGNVHYFFSKRLQKLPGDAGEWLWHQDYGSYWYYDNFLKPDMLTVWIALDEATEANGCLHVVRGSHTLGRLDSTPSGNQRAADPARVEAALASGGHHDEVAVTLQPGGALFMHGNTLHRSGPNTTSDSRRLAFATHFTRGDNLQFADPGPHVPGTSAMLPEPHGRLKLTGVQVGTAGLIDPRSGADRTRKE